MVDIIWITDTLAISPAFTTDELPDLKKMGIGVIVDIRSEDKDDADAMRQLGIDFFHVPVDDMCAPTQVQLESIMQFIRPWEPSPGNRQKILIHCQYGYGRSPLVALSVLIERGMNKDQALALLYKSHPAATFSHEQEAFISRLKKA